MSKVKCVYPYIKSKEDFTKCGVADLMEDTNVRELLGKNNAFFCEHREDFANKIKPFIDSNNFAGRNFALWPLVKMVRLDVKSSVLKEGICLVDLPGSHDSNVARGKIAENFQKKLTISCIISPSTRAQSDKPVSE